MSGAGFWPEFEFWGSCWNLDLCVVKMFQFFCWKKKRKKIFCVWIKKGSEGLCWKNGRINHKLASVGGAFRAQLRWAKWWNTTKPLFFSASWNCNARWKHNALENAHKFQTKEWKDLFAECPNNLKDYFRDCYLHNGTKYLFNWPRKMAQSKMATP